ncbi:uncharacterized protein [Panulirus ornatus]|uniref:uncharacterized protein n=1 Tax=Panulirus ornatus TaxID=150431 RepID=UPI003A8C1FB4
MVAALEWESQELYVACCESRVLLWVAVPVVMYRWHHFCLALDLTIRKYWLAYDHMYLEEDLPAEGGRELAVHGGGRLVLGQDLDSLEGGFNDRQSVHGNVADFILLPQALHHSYLKDYVKCQPPETDLEAILYFGDDLSAFELKGSINVSVISLDTICRYEPHTQILLPQKLNFFDSRAVCAKLGGTLAVPTNREENEKILDEFIEFSVECTDSYGTMYWLGIKGHLDTGEWIAIRENKSITWNNFFANYEKVRQGQQCVSVGGINFPYYWYSTNCAYIVCPLCNFTTTPAVTLRGLCKNSLIDRKFFIKGYKDGKPLFQGPIYTSIYWNNDTALWTLTSRRHENLMGHMETKFRTEYPLGVHTWVITGDKCSANKVEVLMSACGETQYTCHDGTCIAKAERCDLTANCPDQSDELNCRVVNTPISYSLDKPPPNKILPVPVRIFLEITSVRQVNIMGFKLVVDIILRFQWRDGRLTMKNLREDINMNKVQDPESLWIPHFQVEDGARSIADLVLRSQSLMVQKEGLPIADDDTGLNEDDVYLGSENTLLLYRMYTVDFTCQFRLHAYPFDSQICSIAFSLVGISPAFVVLQKVKTVLEFLIPSADGHGVSFTGQKLLLEYQVTTVNMTPFSNLHESGQKVWLELRNLQGYYISSTYIPTLLLVIICYYTFYFDITDFTDRVMVSLTSLLVLAALFSQTSQSIPKTAYLKLIDVWFVFLIFMDFLIILIIVIVENLRLKKREASRPGKLAVVSVRSSLKDESPRESSQGKGGVNKSAVTTNRLARVTVPVLMIIFISTYVYMCSTGSW